MNGAQFAALLRRLPAEELELEVATLVELYDRTCCADCGRHHDSPWEAIACDELTDARRRRDAAHWLRMAAVARDREPPLTDTA